MKNPVTLEHLERTNHRASGRNGTHKLGGPRSRRAHRSAASASAPRLARGPRRVRALGLHGRSRQSAPRRVIQVETFQPDEPRSAPHRRVYADPVAPACAPHTLRLAADGVHSSSERVSAGWRDRPGKGEKDGPRVLLSARGSLWWLARRLWWATELPRAMHGLGAQDGTVLAPLRHHLRAGPPVLDRGEQSSRDSVAGAAYKNSWASQ